MEHLHVLYACNDPYMLPCGVSITSLFENNRDIESITVYIAGENLSEGSKRSAEALAAQYQRDIQLLDASALDAQIKDAAFSAYRGSYAAAYRLFFDRLIPSTVDRLLYLDSDTLVVGSLRPLLTFDFGDNVCAMAFDSLSYAYKQLLGFAPDAPYYNTGALLFHCNAWREQNCTQRIFEHIREVRADYVNPDQDVINLCMRGKIATLSPAFNLQPHHRRQLEAAYEAVYWHEGYYDKQTLAQAIAAPVVLHSFRFLGQFPWYKNTLHPDKDTFLTYQARSPWQDAPLTDGKNTIVFRIERLLYRILPHTFFLRLFEMLQRKIFTQQNAAKGSHK